VLFVQKPLLVGKMSIWKAKKAVHTSTVAGPLLRREQQLRLITEYLEGHIGSRSSGALYILGSPGVGKTAVITQVMDTLKRKCAAKWIMLNCMMLKNLADFKTTLKEHLKLKAGADFWGRFQSTSPRAHMV